MFDLILANARVIDGTGCPWFAAEVGILGERIAAVGTLTGAQAKRTIDVGNRMVCPGFVDAHVHGDLAMLADPQQRQAVYQGVTTYVIGQDGCGFAPASRSTQEFMRRYTAGFSGDYPQLDCNWSSVDEYLSRFDRACSINAAYLIPNGTVRLEAMGLATRLPTPAELDAMKRLVRQGMEQGAVGLSTGLDYIPSLYAETDEIAELCQEIAPFDGVYVSHIRSHGGAKTSEAIDEVYAIGQTAGCAVHISHFGVRADTHLDRIDQGRQAGLDVTFDTYPYLAGMTFLAMLGLPGWVQEGGVDATLERLADRSVRAKVADWFQTPRFPPECMRLANVAAPKYRNLEGMNLKQAAEATGLPIAELICELVYESKLNVSSVVHMPGRTDADLVACMTHPCHMASSDGIFSGRFAHPRGWGAFAKYLGEYTREKKVWTLAEAVRHLSYHACRRYRLPDRGLVRPGMIADLVVFDPDRIADRSTYDDPQQFAVGVEHVLVGGVLTLENGVHTGATNGRGLRRG